MAKRNLGTDAPGTTKQYIYCSLTVLALVLSLACFSKIIGG